MRRRRVALPYGIEGWVPARRWAAALAGATWWAGILLAGIGLGWIVLAVRG